MSKSTQRGTRRWRYDAGASDADLSAVGDSSAEEHRTGDALPPLGEDAALETFHIEVSAGRSGGAGEVPLPEGGQPPVVARRPDGATEGLGAEQPPAHPPSTSASGVSRGTRPTSRASPAANTAAATGARERAHVRRAATVSKSGYSPGKAATGKRAPGNAARQSNGASRAAVKTATAPTHRSSRRPTINRRRSPGLIGSLLVHAAGIAMLALGTLQVARPDFDLEFAAAAPVDEPLDTLAEVDFEPIEEWSQEEPFAEVLDESFELGGASLGDVTAAEAFADLPGVGGLGDEGLGDLGGLLDGNGLGIAGVEAGLGSAPPPAFFGHMIEGRRIVFVLDNSGSMQDGRLETVIAELIACVDALTPRQEFYVIFYSDAVYPLFYPQPAMQFVRPTDRVKRQLAAWLETVELCLGDSVDEALAAAASIGPDAVYLLSDGRIQSQKKLRFLLAAETRNFPIHTIGVGMGRSVAGREKLQLIAEVNGGAFLERDVSDEMKQVALKSPRPYHNEQPGAVWGRNVKNGWGR